MQNYTRHMQWRRLWKIGYRMNMQGVYGMDGLYLLRLLLSHAIYINTNTIWTTTNSVDNALAYNTYIQMQNVFFHSLNLIFLKLKLLKVMWLCHSSTITCLIDDKIICYQVLLACAMNQVVNIFCIVCMYGNVQRQYFSRKYFIVGQSLPCVCLLQLPPT